ncbi:MAG: hypothetical protein QM802_23555 [Agriterribacter sp.]
MKKYFNQYSILFVLGILVLVSCKKTDLPHGQNPPPQDTAKTGKFSIAIDSLPGITAPATDLTAIVSVADKQHNTVIASKRMPLTLHSKYETDTLSLPVGNYEISGLLIIDKDSAVKFASPHSGSVKAPLVTHALSIPFQVKKEKSTVITEVLRVSKDDKAEDFGYPAGSFGNEPPPDDSDAYVTIKILPIIKVGDIVYDSIPVTLFLKAYDEHGQYIHTTRILNAGTNELQLAKAPVKHVLQVYKWNTTDEIEIKREDLKEGMIYYIGGHREALKLKEVLNYMSTSTGGWTPQSKQYYQYDQDQLMHIQHYLKREDQTPYIAFAENMEYTGGKITAIKARGEAVPEEEVTSFSYDGEGKLYHMENQSGGERTSADVTYSALEERSGISVGYSINAVYSYTHHANKMYYAIVVKGGNVVQDNATSSGGGESSNYQYDFGINPFAHLHLPDLYFSNLSRNNRTMAWKNYYGVTPQTEPYEFSYTYNSDGYPKELITKYWYYSTKKYAHSIKTVFSYY